MAMSNEAKHLYDFGPFRLDMAERHLLRGGKVVPLTPKLFDTLVVLVENSGRTLEKDELMHTVWPDSFVEESSLEKQPSPRPLLLFEIAVIHTALGDRERAFRWLEKISADKSKRLLIRLKFDPRLDALRSDSRFETILNTRLPLQITLKTTKPIALYQPCRRAHCNTVLQVVNSATLIAPEMKGFSEEVTFYVLRIKDSVGPQAKGLLPTRNVQPVGTKRWCGKKCASLSQTRAQHATRSPIYRAVNSQVQNNSFT